MENQKPSQENRIVAKLSDVHLIRNLKTLIKEERRIGADVIEHLHEIDRRRLYSALGFQSLFDYCVRELGYSEGSAQRRVLAARALRKNPEAAAALKEGKVSVTTLALFQEFNQKAKLNQTTQADHDKKNPDCPALEGALFGGKTGNEEAKINYSSLKLESIFGLSKLQTEKKLFAITGLNLKTGREKKKQVSSTQTQVTLTLTELQLKKLELAKGRLAHRLKQNTYAELIELLAEIAIEQTTPKIRNSKKPSEPTSLAKCPEEPSQPTARPLPAKLSTRYIPRAIKAKIWQKSEGKCEKCKSIYALQIDHVVPYSLSANSSADNLRLLCRACNLAEAQIWGVLRSTGEWRGAECQKATGATPMAHANDPIGRVR